MGRDLQVGLVEGGGEGGGEGAVDFADVEGGFGGGAGEVFQG